MKYNTPSFQIRDEREVLEIAKSISFASVIYTSDGRVEVDHCPVYVDISNKIVIGHFANNNPNSKSIDQQSVLLTFQGGHGLIKPEWYGTENNVPTWNYVVVHVRGKVETFTEEKRLREMLLDMGKIYSINELILEERLLTKITGFKLTIEEIHGKAKLGQTKARNETENVIEELVKIGNIELANLMKSTLKPE